MKNKNKVVKTDPLDKLSTFADLDMSLIFSAMEGYNVKKAKKFQDGLKDLCFKNGLIDDKFETITALLIRLLVNEKIQQLKGEYNK